MRSSWRLDCPRLVPIAVFYALFSLAPSLFPFCYPFRRGDTNSDGKVDISDGVATLLSLFAGGSPPACEDAADANDSGTIDLSDAIQTFQFLFLGGPPPPRPGPFDCGRDDTDDGLGCWIPSACDPPIDERDYSEFQEFEYVQNPALGFCAEFDKVFSARIQKEAGGQYLLEMSVLREGTVGVDNCLPGFISPKPVTCAVPVAEPPRRLSEEEVRRMRAAFSPVEVIPSRDPICRCVAIDPCVISEFRWDEDRVSAFQCSEPRMDFSEGQRIQAFLETLRVE